MPAAVLGLVLLWAVPASGGCPPTLDFSFRPLAGETPIRLCEQYAGKVLLVVNTASQCGYTPQYAGLEALYERYRERGLVVLGFPSNDFGGQEPGTEAEIKQFFAASATAYAFRCSRRSGSSAVIRTPFTACLPVPPASIRRGIFTSTCSTATGECSRVTGAACAPTTRGS